MWPSLECIFFKLSVILANFGETVPKVLHTAKRVLGNTSQFCVPALFTSGLHHDVIKERKYHIFAPKPGASSSDGTFEYLGHEVYFFLQNLQR